MAIKVLDDQLGWWSDILAGLIGPSITAPASRQQLGQLESGNLGGECTQRLAVGVVNVAAGNEGIR
jgi:hypothetical protein